VDSKTEKATFCAQMYVFACGFVSNLFFPKVGRFFINKNVIFLTISLEMEK